MAVIVVAHSKGGVGKSLIAWNLAIAKNTPILDLDYQKSLVFANKFRINNDYKAIKIMQPTSQKEFIDFLEEYPEDKDIVVDVGGFDSSTNRVALFIADIIITPVNEDMQEIAGLIKFHATLEELSTKMNKKVKAHIVINNVNPNSKDFAIVSDFSDKYELYEKLNTVIARRADFSKAMKEGLGITEYTKDSSNKARQSILSLKKEIDIHIKNMEKIDG
ncbi:MAG: ParA family protein [Sulfurovum sp.]|nr:ParA family protein [Sulfurovum sp.]